MAFLIILLVVAVALSAESIRMMCHDGRPVRPPRSHFDDPDFRSPASRV